MNVHLFCVLQVQQNLKLPFQTHFKIKNIPLHENQKQCRGENQKHNEKKSWFSCDLRWEWIKYLSTANTNISNLCLLSLWGRRHLDSLKRSSASVICHFLHCFKQRILMSFFGVFCLPVIVIMLIHFNKKVLANCRFIQYSVVYY